MQSQTGTLYVVATPIGNLKDITLRALEVLRMVDRIVAEDTRHSMRLLEHFSINKPTLSLHDFNEAQRVGGIVDYLKKGESIALISDAGTPLISDPGYQLVKAVGELGIPIVPVPGACAAIVALSVSGLPTDQFCFEGFLPAKHEARRKRLVEDEHESRTLIFYEAPHRLHATLKTMEETFGPEREGVVARELTKIHESVIRGNLNYLATHFENQNVKGECVILIKGAEVGTSISDAERVLDILLKELPLKQAVELANKITNARKNELYQLALTKRKQ